MYIVSTGMLCPVGLNAESACAAMRAGVSAFEELPYRDNSGEPIMGAIVPGYTLEVGNFESRLVEMLACAVEECLGKAKHLSAENLPLFVALAEAERPGFPTGLAGNIIGRLEGMLGIKFHPEFSQVLSSGHTSGFEALGIAHEILKNSELPACLVCGVDSYIRASSLLWLDQHHRLKTEKNSDGVIPGEAAGAVIVGSFAQQNNTGRNILISAIGTGSEYASVLDDNALMAKGMSCAIKAALTQANMEMHDIDLRMTDVTGEAYYFKEQLCSKMKLQREDAKQFVDLWHLSEYMGDVGSVSGLVQLIYTKETIAGKIDQLRNLLCTTSNVLSNRVAVIIQVT